MQLVLSERQTLAIVKIFDPSRNYPTRSIPGTLDLLGSNADLWRVYDQEKLQQVLIEAGMDRASVERLDNTELTQAVVARFRNTLPDPRRVTLDKLSLSLSILRQSRDKTIAHNEAIDPSELRTSTWGEAIALADYARRFIATIGAGYLGLLFGEGSEDYVLMTDARRTSIALRRLLKTVGITPD